MSKKKQIILISKQMIGMKYSTLRGESKQKTRMGWIKSVTLDKFVEQAGAIFLRLLKVKNDVKTVFEIASTTGSAYSGGYHDGDLYSGYPRMGNYQSSYKKKEKYIIIDPADEDVTRWTYDDEDFMAAAIEAGLEIKKEKDGKDEETVVYLKEATYKLEYPAKRSVQTCGFQGTKEYLFYMFGRSLHGADEDWYRACPLNEASGVPMHYAATVINDLVSPYNMGVTRVFVRKGLSTHTDAPAWMQSLGINPMAINDHTIDNREFVKRVVAMKEEAAKKNNKLLTDEDKQKMTDEMMAYSNKNYRFEYVEHAPKGSILLYAMSSKGTGAKAASFATGHGHTKFYPPRERDDEQLWKLAIQLDELQNISYKEPPPVCPEPECEKILQPWDCMVDGYPMRAYDKKTFSWDKRLDDLKQKEKAEEAKKHGSTKSKVDVKTPEVPTRQ